MCQVKETKPYIEAIQKAIHTHAEGRYQHRLHVVLMAIRLKSAKEAATIYGESLRTVQYWIQKFFEKGLDGLKDETIPGRPSRLSKKQKQELKEDILKSPVILGYDQNNWDGILLSYHIGKKYNVSLKVRQCQYLLHQLGFTLQRPRPMPKGNPKIKAEFKKKPVSY